MWLVSQQPSVIQGYQKGILTPNFMEFTRLYESLVGLLEESRIGESILIIPCVNTSIPLCVVVSAPWGHGQHRSSAQCHAAQCSHGQCHPGAKRRTGSHFGRQQGFVSSRVLGNRASPANSWPFPFKSLPRNRFWELFIFSPFHDCALKLWLLVFSHRLQYWRQWEKMWRTGWSSVGISGSFSTLGPCHLCSWNVEKVKYNTILRAFNSELALKSIISICFLCVFFCITQTSVQFNVVYLCLVWLLSLVNVGLLYIFDLLFNFVILQCESISGCSIWGLFSYKTVQQPSVPAARQIHHYVRHDPGDWISLQKAIWKLKNWN